MQIVSMENYMRAIVWLPLNALIYSKPRLLAIIAAVAIAVLAVPVIIPHLTDTSIIYHLILHISSIIIAIFLSVVSILSIDIDTSHHYL